jgi:hypothetical protein
MIVWQQDWRAFDIPEKEAEFLRELREETGAANPEHPLHGKECRILGWRERGWKDFILHLPADDHYAYVHLTWHEETDPQRPYCEMFENVDAVNEFLRNCGQAE